MGKSYSPEIADFIRDNVVGRTAQELADLTNAAFGTSFTASSMKSYKQNHKLRSGTPCGIPKGRPTDLFPAEVVAFIRANYKGVGWADMAEMLNGEFDKHYTKEQIAGYYKNHKLNSGLTGRFEKGHVSHNKGRKGYCAPGSEKGWFTKGSQPWDTAPVGTVVEREGYLWKKFKNDLGSGRFNWKQVHLLNWEAAHGPVPDGYVIIFKDGNHMNTDLGNLELVSKAENAVMNRCNLRFNHAEHTETGILIAKVKIAAKDRKDNRQRNKSHNRNGGKN